MAVPFLKVFYTGRDGVEQDITEFANLENKRGLQIKDAKCQLSINNSRYRYKIGGESCFVEDGTIEIYADYSPIEKTSAQLTLSGQIQDISHNFGGKGTDTKLSVSDKTSLLLGGLWSKNYEVKPGTSPQRKFYVNELVEDVLKNSPNNDNLVTSNNVVATTSSGGSFPEVTMSKSMKPIYEWLTDLSQPGVTGEDKAYLFYVDKENDLHWFYPSATITGSIIEGSDEIYSISMRKSQDELVNMVLYNAGQDLYGNGNTYYKFNTASKSNKLRMKFQPMIEIGRDLFDAELVAGNLIESSGGAFHYQGKDYVRNGTITPTWGGSSISDNDDYNDAFRTQQRVLADSKASAYMQAFSGLRWKGSIELKGTNNYTAGDFVLVQLPTVGIPLERLRVWDVQQSFGSDGWITSLELREDDEPISGS